MNRFAAIQCRSARRAFTFIEVLIALIICGMIMAALGSAMVVYARSADANTDYTRLVQRCEMAQLRISNDVRSASSCQLSDLSNGLYKTLIINYVPSADGTTRTSAAYRIQTLDAVRQLRFYADRNAASSSATDIRNNSALAVLNLDDSASGFTAQVTGGITVSIQTRLTASINNSGRVSIADSATIRSEAPVW